MAGAATAFARDMTSCQGSLLRSRWLAAAAEGFLGVTGWGHEAALANCATGTQTGIERKTSALFLLATCHLFCVQQLPSTRCLLCLRAASEMQAGSPVGRPLVLGFTVVSHLGRVVASSSSPHILAAEASTGGGFDSQRRPVVHGEVSTWGHGSSALMARGLLGKIRAQWHYPGGLLSPCVGV